jgi:hypothetical protein
VTPPPTPIVRVCGSHREVGEAVRRFAAAPFDRELIECYRAVTFERLP